MSAIYYEGCRYIVVFSDDYSKYRFPVFMKDRTTSTLLEAWRLYYAHMRALNVELAAWQSDGGPEYVSSEAFDFCDEHAIQRLVSVRYTPESNGTAERVFGVHIPRARSMIAAAGMTKRAYALAFQYSL